MKKLLKTFYGFLPFRIKYMFFKYRIRARIVEGLPKRIDFKILNQLCRDQLGAPIKGVSYVHLSGWKSYGTYRLLLKTENGQPWSLIYKNEIYDLQQIPGLKGLPVVPGPPEYFVYSHRQDALNKYLPIIYLCLEKTPGRHYQYFLEDTMWEYRLMHFKREDILRAAAELPRLHHNMSKWSLLVGHHGLLRYDREFSTALLRYAKNHLENYARRTMNELVSDVCKLWPRISIIYQRKEFYEIQNICPIHGDYNRTNIHFHRKDKARMKVVDWEWAGLGVPHADLASLLKKVLDPEIEQQALIYFSEQDKRLSFDEHNRLYHWCQLGRGLLDGAYLTRQQSVLHREINWLPNFINGAMYRVLKSYRKLI